MACILDMHWIWTYLPLPGATSQYPSPQADLHQSCRHPVRSWANQSFGAHLHNMTLANGRLRVPQDGRYYLYAQVYFRYPSPSEGEQKGTSHQLVQCVYKKTSYLRPIQLLKGVGTKCWAPDAEYALHSVYQGGLFELRAGDEVFVSVSSPSMVHAEDSSSYFGAFRLDLWGQIRETAPRLHYPRGTGRLSLSLCGPRRQLRHCIVLFSFNRLRFFFISYVKEVVQTIGPPLVFLRRKNVCIFLKAHQRCGSWKW